MPELRRGHTSIFAPVTFQMVAGYVIGFGILLRLWQYGVNRSLWTDEAALALNIVERSFTELLQPLSYDQAAPLGFLWLEKVCLICFGNSEYALRLLPLVAGIVAIFLVYRLAVQSLKPLAALIALTLFCSSRDLIYYTSEVKQYSSDVAIALLCFDWAQSLRQRLSRWQVLGVAVGGAVLIWFSHPAVFTLFGVGGVAVAGRGGEGEKREKREERREKREERKKGGEGEKGESALRVGSVWGIGVVFGSWLVSFVGLYWFSLRRIRSSEYLEKYWVSRDAFPTEWFDLNWLFHSFWDFFKKPLGFAVPFDAIAIVLFILGCIALLRRGRLLLLLAPAIATLLATYLQKYPFHSRLVLFLSPFAFLLIGQGGAELWGWWQRLKAQDLQVGLKKMALYAVSLNLFLLLAVPVLDAGSLLVKPRLKEELKPVLNYMRQHRQAEDRLYVFQRGVRTFQYYALKYGYQPGDYILGVDDLDAQDGEMLTEAERQRYRVDLNQLRGQPRVWVLFSHIHVKAERQFIRRTLSNMGKKLDEFEARDAFVELYDLS